MKILALFSIEYDPLKLKTQGLTLTVSLTVKYRVKYRGFFLTSLNTIVPLLNHLPRQAGQYSTGARTKLFPFSRQSDFPSLFHRLQPSLRLEKWKTDEA